MTKGNRLSKRKRNVLRRDDYFYFHHYSFQICITDQAWGGQYDWIYGQFFFFRILLDFLKVLYFFPAWLCHETSSFTRSQSANEKKNDANIRHSHISRDVPSLPPKILHKHYFQFLLGRLQYQGEMKNTLKGYAKFGGANKVHYGRCASDESSYLDRTSLVNKVFILSPNCRGFDSQRFVLLLFSILRVGRQPRHWFISFSSLPFPASLVQR